MMFFEKKVRECFCGSGKPFDCCHGQESKLMHPGHVTPMRSVREGIMLPEYAISGRPRTTKPANYIETPAALAHIRTASHHAREVLNFVKKLVKPGVTTEELDAAAHEKMMELGVYPSPLNYGHFPKSICTSVNEVICHGIPDDRPLADGDIINLDVTVFENGVHGDCSEMVRVGTIDATSEKLLRTTWEALRAGIAVVKPGNHVSEIGRAIERVIKPTSFSIVRAYCGHGVGTVFHTELQISHFYDPSAKTRMRPGMVFTIEPMINMGTYKHTVWHDQWTAVTADRLRSAQYEHTLVVTESGCDILTLLPDEQFEFPEVLHG